LQYFVVPKPDNSIAPGFQSQRPTVVFGDRFWFTMLPAIELNDEPPLLGTKINNEISDGKLSPKLERFQTPGTQMLPQFCLGVGLPAPEITGSLEGQRDPARLL
jgi:hypothetical protein